MTQVVTVHTDFGDLNQMAQGLVGRVDPAKVILPGPDPVDAGEWVQFAVTLSDGSPGFAGVGRCVTAVDNGDERSSHQRFDVVIDSLQFDPRGQQIFEHILMLSGYTDEEGGLREQTAPAGEGEFPPEYTGSAIEVPMDELTAVGTAAAAPAPVLPSAFEDELEDEDATKVAPSPLEAEAATPASAFAGLRDDDEDEEEDERDEEDRDDEPVTVPPQMAPAEPETPRATPVEPVRTIPVAAAAPVVVPVAVPAPVAARPVSSANGLSFSYPGGLPFPAMPPRPDIPAAARISPAPRPRR